MLLKLRPVPLTLLLSCLATTGVQAQSVNILLGIDAWDITADASRPSTARRSSSDCSIIRRFHQYVLQHRALHVLG
jgi:hypothetical protein